MTSISRKCSDVYEALMLPAGIMRFLAAVALTMLSGCAVPVRYNSLDLALLPCEVGDSPVFFKAVEFTSSGVLEHPRQVADLKRRFNEGPPVTDVVVFIHGWNKNSSSAELDYQNFLCRLHARLRNAIGDSKRAGGLVVIGIFWPSTITNRVEEPWLIKPFSYYQVRDRADQVAETGLSKLLVEIIPQLENSSSGREARLHLIGHSFGGRMVIRSLETLQQQGQLARFFMSFQSVNVVLVNAATPAARLNWIDDAVAAARRRSLAARFTKDTNSYLYNLHSFNDSANRYLFPIASMLNNDPAICAAGACGVESFPTICIDASGGLRVDEPSLNQVGGQINAWNVDVTPIVFDHSDIYKGRVATLIADLLFAQETKQTLSMDYYPPGKDTRSRCQLEKFK